MSGEVKIYCGKTKNTFILKNKRVFLGRKNFPDYMVLVDQL